MPNRAQAHGTSGDAHVVQPISHHFRADRVLHIQIAKHGRLAFGAYDNFHPECTVVFDDVPQGLLDELRQRGVLRSYIVRNTVDS